jgi:SulP family sulfate permease
MDRLKADQAPNHKTSRRAEFTPKLLTVLAEGYGAKAFGADMMAGLTVAIVALPLSMAIAIASGTTPERGLYTAIIGGFLISLLGGSRFQIGGPAGAFIVLVAATVSQHGLSGMLTATFLAGLILLALGALRLGTYIKFIPYPVTVGFTAGIALIIFSSQIKDLLGLTLTGPDPAELVAKYESLGAALGSFNAAAFGLAVLTIAVIVGLKRWRPTWPGMLIAVVLAGGLALLVGLPVETIGTRFGGVPSSLPQPMLPDLSLPSVFAVLPNAISFALLGAIESLLSAVVADGMTGRRHRSNLELLAQGVANMAAALFGGVPATGTIARTATNVRAGSRGPISGLLHAVFILAFMVLAAPLMSYIPLAALAGVLAVVSWNMVEKHAVVLLARSLNGDTLVLAATFLLTVLKDLTYGIVVGFALAALLFIGRMAKSAGVESDDDEEVREQDPDVVVYRLSGAFFFGAAGTVSAVLDRINSGHSGLVIDVSRVSLLDSSAANALVGVAQGAEKRGVRFALSGAGAPLRAELEAHGLGRTRTIFAPDSAAAVLALKA